MVSKVIKKNPILYVAMQCFSDGSHKLGNQAK